MRALLLPLVLAAAPSLAQDRLSSHCIALAEGAAQMMQVSFGEPLVQDTVRLQYLGHASFLIETAGGPTGASLETFLDGMDGEIQVVRLDQPDLEMPPDRLPCQPTIMVLDPASLD
jgi:hypothetical protein